jgi:hypothetical protein
MLLGSMLAAGGGRWIVPFPVYLVLFQMKIASRGRLCGNAGGRHGDDRLPRRGQTGEFRLVMQPEGLGS